VDPENLSPDSLCAAMESALDLPENISPFPRDGATRAAAAIYAAWSARQ
jgi:hypothetical protein